MEDDVDISALTMEQYIALSPDDIKPGIVNPKIGDDVEFKINAKLIRELRCKIFAGTDNEDAYEHVYTVLEIVDLFHFLGVTHDVIMLRAITTMDKENMKEPVPSDLPPTPFLGHLKEQMGSPYSTRETIHMIRNPEEIHNAKAHREEGDMDVGWDISSKDVKRLRQFLTPTIHTLPNLEPVVQPYIPLGPVHDKDKIVREKEQDYDIPLNDSIMQPLTPQTVHITPPDDDYVAPATNPMSNKQLNKSEEEFSHITKDPTARRHLSRLAQLKIMWSNLLEFAAVFGGNEFSLPVTH
ncbi:hypothetical protein Tco_0999108 [Tanacetum coccineum]